MKLLYAEDEAAMSEAVVDILTYHNYLVDAVYDGEEALAYAQAEQLLSILLDNAVKYGSQGSAVRVSEEGGPPAVADGGKRLRCFAPSAVGKAVPPVLPGGRRPHPEKRRLRHWPGGGKVHCPGPQGHAPGPVSPGEQDLFHGLFAAFLKRHRRKAVLFFCGRGSKLLLRFGGYTLAGTMKGGPVWIFVTSGNTG